LKKAGPVPEDVLSRIDKEFNGYRRLFAKFLESDVTASVQWDKIEKLPADSVRHFILNYFYIDVKKFNLYVYIDHPF